MLTFSQYQEIQRVKDSSPFTQDIPINRYIQQVKIRINRWYGTPLAEITDEQVYKELIKK